MSDKAAVSRANLIVFLVFKLTIANAYFWLGISIPIIPRRPNAN